MSESLNRRPITSTMQSQIPNVFEMEEQVMNVLGSPEPRGLSEACLDARSVVRK